VYTCLYTYACTDTENLYMQATQLCDQMQEKRHRLAWYTLMQVLTFAHVVFTILESSMHIFYLPDWNYHLQRGEFVAYRWAVV